jgi:hypothetical protein
MTLAQATAQAQKTANESGSSVLIYRATYNLTQPARYGVAFTLPMWGERIGERVYPEVSSDDN